MTHQEMTVCINLYDYSLITSLFHRPNQTPMYICMGPLIAYRTRLIGTDVGELQVLAPKSCRPAFRMPSLDPYVSSCLLNYDHLTSLIPACYSSPIRLSLDLKTRTAASWFSMCNMQIFYR